MVLPDDIRERVTSYLQHQSTKPREAILDLVRTSQQRYLDAVSGAPDDVSSRKPAPDEWSLRELTLHVITAQSGVAGIIEHASRGDQPPERRLGMTREDAGEPFADLVGELQQVNAQMLDAITRMPDAPDTTIRPPHPIFGPLNCLEWAVFQRVHDEDHVQHAGKILKAVTAA